MTFGKRNRAKRRTEVVIILVLVVYMGSPVLPHTFDFEDGFFLSGSIVIDTLRSKFMNNGDEKS